MRSLEPCLRLAGSWERGGSALAADPFPLPRTRPTCLPPFACTSLALQDPPPQLREFRQVLFAPWSQHTLRSFGITAGMVASRRLEPWQERWATIVKEYAAVVAICCSDSVRRPSRGVRA